MPRLSTLAPFALMLLAACACRNTPQEPPSSGAGRSPPSAEKCPADPSPGAAPLPRTLVRFIDAPGAATINAEVAAKRADTARGLMYRTSLAEDAGMLFLMGPAHENVFWMQNTCIPLDMLFIDDGGTIVGILENVPILNTAPRTVGVPSTSVLEVNAGWSQRHGVRSGQKLMISETGRL